MFRRLLAIGLLALVSGSSWAAPTSDEYYKTGLKLFTDQRLSESETYFRVAVQLDPKNWKAYLGLGHTAMKAGKKDLAIAAYEHSLYYNPDQPAIRSFVNNLKLGGPAFSTYVWDPAVDPYPLQTGPANPLPKKAQSPREWIFIRTGARVSYLESLYTSNHYGRNTSWIAHNYLPNQEGVFTNGAFGTETYEQLHFGLSRSFSLAVGLEQWGFKSNSGAVTGSTTSNPFTLGFFIHSSTPKVRFSFGTNLILGTFNGQLIDSFKSEILTGGDNYDVMTYYTSGGKTYYNRDTASYISAVTNHSFMAVDNSGILSIDLFPHVALEIEFGLRVGTSGHLRLFKEQNTAHYNSQSEETYYGEYYSYDDFYFHPIGAHAGMGLQFWL
jgi:hypothetical protein